MNIVEVSDKQTIKEFLCLPRKLYKNDPNFISPLDKDIEAVFNPALNNFHSHGIIKRWIARDVKGETVGRIAALINHQKNKNPDFIIGGIGFFESTNDEQTSFLLFDTAKQWLEQNNARAMDGPINFGENDKY